MKITNHAPGMRGINLKDGTKVWLESGQSADIAKADIDGELPDLGTAAPAQSNDDAELIAAVQAENEDLKKQVADQAKEIEALKKAAKPA